MTIEVKLGKKWDKKSILQWIDNPDDEQFEDISREDRMELVLLADLASHYPDIPLNVIKEVAPITIEEAFEEGFGEIIDRWISHKQFARDVATALKENKASIIDNRKEPALR